MEQEKDNIDEATENVEKMASSVEEMRKQFDLKMEAMEKQLANIDKAMVRDNQEEKAIGGSYGFINARKDVQKGKTANAPLWDDRTEKRFNEFLQMKYEKDYKGIQKAFGDNVQTATNWIPDEFRSELVRLAFQNSWWLQNATIVPMGRDKVVMPAPSGNYTVSWVDKGGAMTDSNYTAGTVELDSAKLGGIALVNKEDLEDSAYPIALFVGQQLGEDFGIKIDKECWQGNSGGSDQFDGLEYATSVEEVAGAVDASPSFAELLTEDNILAMVAKLDDREQEGAIWQFNNQGWNAIRAIEDGASSKIVRLNEAYSYDLLGFPVVRRTQVAATTATAERAAGFLGNPRWLYIGDRMDFTVDASEHRRFEYDQVVFRGLQRVAIKVAIPTAFSRIVFGAAA